MLKIIRDAVIRSLAQNKPGASAKAFRNPVKGSSANHCAIHPHTGRFTFCLMRERVSGVMPSMEAM